MTRPARPTRPRLRRDHPFPPPERPRTDTLRGILEPRPPALEDTVVVDIDPEEEATGVMVAPRAVCERCGYRARHVQVFLGGLCGECKAQRITLDWRSPGGRFGERG